MRILRTFRSLDAATEIGGVMDVGTTPVIIDPAAAPAAPAAPAVPRETVGKRIEDVLRGMSAQPAATEAAPAAAAPSEPAATPEELSVILPPRREGEEGLTFQTQTREQADALRRLHNGYLRGEQAREVASKASAQLAELQAFEQRLTADPVGVLLEKVPAGVRASLVEALIASDFDTIKPVIDRLYGDPEAQALARASITDKRTEWGETVTQARTQAEYNASIETAVGDLIPDHATPEDAMMFGRLAQVELEAIDSSAPGTVTPETVSKHLGAIAARLFGAPAAAPERTTAAPAPAAPPAPAVPAPVASVNPAIIAARVAARHVAPQGAGGSPASPLTLTPGQTIQQRASAVLQSLRANGGG